MAVSKPDDPTAPLDSAALAKRSDRMPTVSLVFHHRDGSRVVPLERGVPIVVGRAPPSDVILADANLSRQHARFLWDENGVTVNDLDSLNGTILRGEPVTDAVVYANEEVTLAGISVSVLILSAGESDQHEIDGYDRFADYLERELIRARTFSRPFGLAMVRAIDREHAAVRHWLSHVRKALRPVDHVGAFSLSTLLVGLPQADPIVCRRLASQLTTDPGAEVRLVCGFACFPVDAATPEELVSVARDRARTATLDEPIVGTSNADGDQAAIVVRDPVMMSLYETVDRVASSDVSVLILGDTGTGKEVIARRLHAQSGRAQGPLRCLNCGAIPSTLLESTLFGHEKGAFTGAEARTPGVFEQADGGTVFLDEIGELPEAAQAALLRVLQEKQVRRVGATEEISVDVRVIAATNRDLEAMCDDGTFRADLFYRLNTVPLTVPPLCERPQEILPLAESFLQEAVARHRLGSRKLTEEAVELLQSYSWPGNVRELRNVIERAAVIAEGESIVPEDLGERIRGGTGSNVSANIEPEERHGTFKERIRAYEIELIRDALERSGGNQTEAAKHLNMPLRTLVHKIAAYQLKD